MNLVAVKSSNLQAVGWQDGKLRILFQTGTMYDYFNVPEAIHGALMAAGSKNEYFTENIRERFEYEKVNPEKERNQMGKNKAQLAAAAREAAAKTAQPVAAAPAQPPVTEEPKPEVGTVQAPAPANKQQTTIETLKAAWVAKGVNLSKLAIKDDGKFKLLIVAEGWPTVQVGASGGITVLELKSYAKAFDAAMDGLALYEKQKTREAKKAPAPAVRSATAPVPAAKETPAAKKGKAHEAVEQQLQSASA